MSADTLLIERDIKRMKLLYLSVKYWSKYNLAFFVQHFLVGFQNDFERIHALHTRDQDDMGINRLYYYRALFFSELLYKCWCRYQKNDIRDLLFDANYFEWLQYSEIFAVHNNAWQPKSWSERIEDRIERRYYAKLELKKSIACSWIHCDKQQKEVNAEWKICGGCKMAHYCSKRCQKKSWNSQHRNICRILSERYSL